MNYYQVLGLKENATDREIKSAYRSLAKQFHPDKNKAQNARSKFIAITEAYQILMDEELRSAYNSRLDTKRYRESDIKHREQAYREWFNRYQQQAHSRAENYANSTFAEFEKSPIFRTAMALSRIYNYIFFGAGILMIIGPITMWYLRESGLPNARPWYSFLFPSALGIAFTYGVYYFLFKQKIYDEH